MDVEIVVVGESGKWILNRSRIRIGQGTHCEVCLPAGKYPSVVGEHVALEVVNGALTLAGGSASGGESYLNGRPAGPGAAVRSGDLLRLGAGGPELRIRLLEQEDASRPSEYEPTRVLHEPAPSTHEQTRMMQEPARPTHEPTRVIAGPAAPVRAAAPAPSAGSARQSFSSSRAAYGVSAAAASAPPAAVTAPTAESGSLRLMEEKLKTMRLILLANLALVAFLCVCVFLQGRELAQTHSELRQLQAQAQSAVGQLTPSLDARLSVFEKRMDGMDARIMAAEDSLVKGMDAQAKIAEDRMVNRMNAEIPAMLDKYVARKLADLKH